MEPRLRQAVEAAVGASVVRVEPAAGGDINDTFVITLAGGQRRFLKTHRSSPRGMYPAEAHGLRWLGEANALRVPEVIAVAADDSAEQFLVMEHIASAPKADTHDELLGRGLATLHRASPGAFGLDRDNFIATLPQANTPPADATTTDTMTGSMTSWARFYAERRLQPLLRRAIDAGRATPGLRRAVTGVITRIAELAGPTEPPARLHGDLWGGNAITDERGMPVLIDPAVYGGHREVDLAMMRLFGGFGPRVFQAYAEVYPLSPGHDKRVALYQLYPLLVHVCLFGGHYASQAEQAASQALA